MLNQLHFQVKVMENMIEDPCNCWPHLQSVFGWLKKIKLFSVKVWRNIWVNRGPWYKTTTFTRVRVFNTTFNNISFISLRPVFLVEKSAVPGENHRTAASHW